MSIDPIQKTPLSAPEPALARMATARRVCSFAGWNWAQLLMLTLAVWTALLYIGVGSALGVLPDVAANRMEVRMLAQLRQGGASPASRWSKSEPSQEVSAWAIVSGPPVLLHVHIAVVLPLSNFWPEPAEGQAEQPRLAGLQFRAVPRWHTPLTRAPPSKTLQA